MKDSQSGFGEKVLVRKFCVSTCWIFREGKKKEMKRTEKNLSKVELKNTLSPEQLGLTGQHRRQRGLLRPVASRSPGLSRCPRRTEKRTTESPLAASCPSGRGLPEESWRAIHDGAGALLKVVLGLAGLLKLLDKQLRMMARLGSI